MYAKHNLISHRAQDHHCDIPLLAFATEQLETQRSGAWDVEQFR